MIVKTTKLHNNIFSRSSIQIPPGAVTTLALAPKEKILLPSPFKSSCINSWQETKLFLAKNFEHVFFGLDYDEEFCKNMCYMEMLWAKHLCIWRDRDTIDLLGWRHNTNVTDVRKLP